MTDNNELGNPNLFYRTKYVFCFHDSAPASFFYDFRDCSIACILQMELQLIGK
jgi:hypothetical protein